MAQIFPLLFSSNDVKALLGSAPLRVYGWGQAPPDSVIPYVTFGVVSGVPQNHLDSVPDMDLAATQVDIWAATEDSSRACFAAIRDVLEAYAHMTSFSTEEFDNETKLYRTRMEFDFFEAR